MCSFFKEELFYDIYRTPTTFPGGLKVKKQVTFSGAVIELYEKEHIKFSEGIKYYKNMSKF